MWVPTQNAGHVCAGGGRTGLSVVVLISEPLTSHRKLSVVDPMPNPYCHINSHGILMGMHTWVRARVSIINYQLYRHIETPGWKLSWTWPGDEVIWTCGEPWLTNKEIAMNVGTASSNVSDMTMPRNFSLGVPGYTCGDPFQVPPSRFPEEGGRRWTQALTPSSHAPNAAVAVKEYRAPNAPSLVKHHVVASGRWTAAGSSEVLKAHVPNPGALACENKLQRSITQVFSFNYRSLNEHGTINDTGMFWGIQYYNELLLQAGESGNVQTEMLLHKDPGISLSEKDGLFQEKYLSMVTNVSCPHQMNTQGSPTLALRLPTKPLHYFVIVIVSYSNAVSYDSLQ
ncbi:COBRA-like protein 7 [Vitis vinifera]|uniref:COBRA-like protein 7 n=1 Tax=Vitis vinifera TaxID=29760 RepID=A0A438GVR1_VITVI|nr:COBRA-like protein 7 [Vitis vinifera]